jgi:hypothetical protein
VSTPLRERPDAPLGTLIFRAGLLPAETIESALEEGVKTGKRLGEILTERGLLKEVDLARLLAGQKGLEFVPVREHIVDPGAASLFTHDQARLFRALPYAFEEGVPVVAIPDPTDEVVLRNIREALGRDEVRFVVSTRGEIAEIVEDVYSKPLPGPDSAVSEAPVPATPVEEPGFVRNPEPPSAPASDAALPEQAANGNGASADTAPLLEVAPAAPAPAPAAEPAPLEVVEPPAPEPTLASPPVEEQVLPENPVVAEPPAPAEPEADPEPVLHAEPEVAHVEPAPSPEPAPTPEPAAAPEPVSSLEPVPAPEPAHAPEPHAPAEPAQAPVPLPEPVSPPAPAPYPPAASTPAAADPLPPTGGALYEVTIRLVNGERVEAGTFQELAAAKECARALMAQVAAAGQGEWPFVNGRFLKPDTIVSVDIAEPAGGAS